MAIRRRNEFRAWYSVRRVAYQELAQIVAQTVQRLISNAHISILSVTWRAKEIDSAAEKASRKHYSNAEEQITDLAGIRVITFVESDIPRIAELVRGAFEILPEKSSDKSVELGVDRSGYRSLHYVCRLGSNRAGLPEFESFKEFLFEIQIRTALQHAWAEVEHNRHYKFAGVLPKHLERRLYLLAGMLEFADRELSAIAGEVDTYSRTIMRSARAGELDIEINSPSVISYLKQKQKALAPLRIHIPRAGDLETELVKELTAFGITTLSELDKLFTDAFVKAINVHESDTNTYGLLRSAMMYNDLEKYFALSWQNHWQIESPDSFNTIASKYGEARLSKMLNRHGISVGTEEHDYEE